MTISEFSSEFDVLYNNIMSNQAPGLSEYEKSVFLTQAQESLILDIYNGVYNQESFENTEEVTRYINTLVTQETITNKLIGQKGISDKSVFYQLPLDLWFITYESCILKDDLLGCKNNKVVSVKPITQDEYYKTSNNPFRKANSSRVLRLSFNNISELISDYNIDSYLVRYITKPSPIILEDLSSYDILIDGEQSITECKLNPVVHRTILNRAVQIAKITWTSGK